MERYVEEFSTLVAVEQQLLNAAGAVGMAELRLSTEDPLHEELGALLRALEAAVDLTRKTKRLLLAEWKAALAAQPAA